MTVDTKDGRWHPAGTAEFTDRVLSMPRTVGRLVESRRRAFHGKVARFHEGSWENESCPHAHAKRAAALKCAEAAAKRLNRSADR